MNLLLETLVVELERPRGIPAQVAHHLANTYGVEPDGIGPFLVNVLPGLEDYEIDLIFSPVFTPVLADQAVFAELLGRDSIPRDQWSALVQQLVIRPVCARIVGARDEQHVLPLREVSIERYVHRLRLDATIPESLFNVVSHLSPAADRPMLKAIARRAVWENDSRRDMLVRYLTAGIGSQLYSLRDATELLKLAEVYQLADAADLLSRIPQWQKTLRRDIQVAGSPKVFFNERVQELHGGGRDQRRQDDTRIAARENEVAILERLQKVFAF
jgi:hypothetical protein